MASIDFLPVHSEPESLRWDGEELVDVVGGGRSWSVDGTERAASRNYGYPFDRAVVSPSGRYVVIYTERDTKALVLDGTRIVRELNRSYCHATDFDYPVALGMLPDGREIVVHCPDDYNVLEVDDVESGQRLTKGDRDPQDVFHSRLAVSPDGRHVLSAGWLWHPVGIIKIFDLQHALREPAVLDGAGLLPMSPGSDAEVASACWLDSDRVAVATTQEIFDNEEINDLGPAELGVWSICGERWLHRTRVDYRIGTMVARGDTVVSLYEHPRLIQVETGTLIAEWPEVKVARKDGSYGVTHVPTPVAALHPDGTPLAVAQPDSIAIIPLPTP
ncbi:MAG: hypothetical protein DLM55_00650 [Acidimicrobiales bacterium]|nr:MAG: hypothetical protein DLM55_00650 [Acidimicrobiales bacterium]